MERKSLQNVSWVKSKVSENKDVRILHFSYWLIISCLFLAQTRSGIAQDQANVWSIGNAKWKIRTVATCLNPSLPFDAVNGTLTYDGTELLVLDQGKKLSLYEVSDLTESVVSTDPKIYSAWTDSQTGGVLVRSSMSDTIDFHRKIPCALIYFENPQRLREWTPTWRNETIGFEILRTHRVAGTDFFVVFARDVGDPSKFKSHFLDLKSGNTLGVIDLRGSAIGVELEDDEVVLYYIHMNERNNTYDIRCAYLKDNYSGIARSQFLFPLPIRNIHPVNGKLVPHFNSMGRFETSRAFRLRGNQSGDVRSLVQRRFPDLEFWKHGDYETGEEEFFDGQLSTRFPMGIGIVSALESPSEYELVLKSGQQFMNHQGDRLEIHASAMVSDAVFNLERSVIATYGAIEGVKCGNRDSNGVQVWTVER